ncbi:hypothetical protein J2T23_000457 [Pseudarthrobacter niigatensis]|uniref:Uncharacterized protein n=1 Tax=Pseudarthrobacter niigatensis TaxID=369935 RepID=A0AAJ1WFL8_9MICC|nr:hypothetical protein [Pseudarthrobacter niigatensis]MDQ0265229.1 hypothetical protein [Pseudarthrobacter niigatensis]
MTVPHILLRLVTGAFAAALVLDRKPGDARCS